ncbi:hypothetical protein [Acetobacter pasteurianus]|uniref:Uncharacterized protein n=1 Tax=Acetobacter pasteurianus NBRC 3188 TaxID=1226663 RepID=A0A401WQ16_ACEPA|nr:hypothetical protein [Acetobacter pasteurianus]GCD51409.1 hypothetical protein NBRC3188_0106 [Acetobacter pasteurianus NBRC 3188]
MHDIQIQKYSKQEERISTKASLTPWSIRGVSPDVRASASSHAKKAGMTIGEWLEVAIREKIKNDRNAEKSMIIIDTGKSSIDMNSVNHFIDLIAKMQNVGIRIPERLSVQTGAMLNRLARDIRKGTVVAPSHDEALPSD